jgi:hypothetical protein
MTGNLFFHGTFTLNRVWAATPGRVFKAWSDSRLKAQWFTGPPERWTLVRRSMDFRVGGSEVLEGRFNESGMQPMVQENAREALDARMMADVFDDYVHAPMQRIVGNALCSEAERDPRGVADAHAMPDRSYDWREARLQDKEWAARVVDEAGPYRRFFPLGAPDRD